MKLRFVDFDSRIDFYAQIYSTHFHMNYPNTNQFTFNSLLIRINFTLSINSKSILVTKESNIYIVDKLK
jgi:hypothetical protein